MSGLMDPNVDKYLYSLLPKRNALLTEMERYAHKHGVPIIGPAVGRMIYFLAQISGARRIFEMGSAIGYSTIWLARAAGPRAEVYYTDGDSDKRATGAGEFPSRERQKPYPNPRRRRSYPD